MRLPVDSRHQLAEQALERLAAGASGAEVESERLDCKEDPARIDERGQPVADAASRDDRTAQVVAEAAACLANSSGGVVIVGVPDRADRPIVGTGTEVAWLRQRVWELTHEKLVVDVAEADVGGKRILVVLVPDAIELVRFRGRAAHRVGRQCVEIDATTWAQTRAERGLYDWSAQSSGLALSSARSAALDVARDLIRGSDEPGHRDLATSTDQDLLRRLGVTTDEAELNNAGALLFTATGGRVIDHRRREVAGGDSLLRVDRDDRSLLELFRLVEDAIETSNPITHRATVGFGIDQVHAIPPAVIREAIANAAAHRDWTVSEPIVVEHVGDLLVVESPGGFPAGVSNLNVLTAQRARNRVLADALRTLRLAERQGVGVDRMYRDMVRLGHEPPAITEVAGPQVRCSIVGGPPEPRMLELWSEVARENAIRTDLDVDVALIVHRLRQQHAVSMAEVAEILQKPELEAVAAMRRASELLFRQQPLVVPTSRTERYRQPDIRFGDSVRALFGSALPYHRVSLEESTDLVVDHVRRFGRIKNADYSELFGVSPTHAGRMLAKLATPEGGQVLAPGRSPNRGRDAHYVPGPGFPDTEEP